MNLFLSHIWVPYVITVILTVIALFFKLGSSEMLFYPALLNIVPVLGLWFIRTDRIVPAFIIAFLCCFLFIPAVTAFRKAVRSNDKKLIRGGAVIGSILVLCTALCCISSSAHFLQNSLTVCCVTGMLSTVYISWWAGEFGKGMRSV